MSAATSPETTTTPSLRERQVTQYLLLGQTYGAIARRLGISPHTVDTYVRRIKLKLGAANRAQLVVSALLAGWVTPPAEALAQGRPVTAGQSLVPPMH